MRDTMVYNFGLPTGSGPDAQPQALNLSDAPGQVEIEAWISNFGGSNVHIVAGALNVAQAQDLVERGLSDVLMTVTGAGTCSRMLPEDTRSITVYFEGANASGQTQMVTVKLTKHPG